MSIVTNAVVLAEEVAAQEGSVVSPYIFGGAAFAILCLLLVATWMLKVGE
jgi:hypothetical protein